MLFEYERECCDRGINCNECEDKNMNYQTIRRKAFIWKILFALTAICIFLMFAITDAGMVEAADKPNGENHLRREYPRPDWHRSDYINLNGTWHFDFDKNGGDRQNGGTPEIIHLIKQFVCLSVGNRS